MPRLDAVYSYLETAAGGAADSSYGQRLQDSSTRIVFLDVDGVLNSLRSAARDNAAGKTRDTLWMSGFYGGHGGDWSERIDRAIRPDGVLWDQECVGHLRWLLQQTGALVVISSTWKVHCPTDCFRRMLAFYDCEAEVVGATPDLRHHGDFRGNEIKLWLDFHPAIRRYVILDDCGDMTDEQKAGHFVQTDSSVGLTRADAEQAAALLLADPS